MAVYSYSDVRVLGVYDGDTARFELTSAPVDVGFGMFVRGSTGAFSCRILGYASRELKEPGGEEARYHLATLLGTGKDLIVESVRWDKYGGRFDGHVFRHYRTECIAHMMIDAGYGVPWNGKGIQPKPPWPLP
jgi:endonuclease YncB( thermonuclease family)